MCVCSNSSSIGSCGDSSSSSSSSRKIKISAITFIAVISNIYYTLLYTMQVYATDGGSDIDLCLFKILKEKIYTTTNIDINTVCPLSQETGVDCIQDPAKSAQMCTAAAVHTMAEEIKKKLTTMEKVVFTCLLPDVYKVCMHSIRLYVCVVYVYNVYIYSVSIE